MAATDVCQFLSEAGDLSVVNRRHVAALAGLATPAAILAAVLLTPHTSAVYVPLVQAQADRPVPAYAFGPPAGYTCFGTDGDTLIDVAGTRWHHCQAKDEKGQIVWAEGASPVQQTGHGGRATFERGPDGWAYLSVWDFDTASYWRVPINGWKAW